MARLGGADRRDDADNEGREKRVARRRGAADRAEDDRRVGRPVAVGCEADRVGSGSLTLIFRKMMFEHQNHFPRLVN